MQEVLIFLEENPQLMTVVELVAKIVLCVLGIIIYRRTGKVLNTKARQEERTVTPINPVDGLSVDELTEFAFSLSQTVDKIHELQEKRSKK